ncbi:MAG TPA: hypothetical protein VGJ94_07190 [Syntrophorhabdaceae bacterium]|jgi:hypothetical protein
MDVKREKYRRIRGAILKFLATEHPGAIDSKVLYHLLDDVRYTMTEEEFLSHTIYLTELGYMRRDERQAKDIEIVMYVITPAGLNLLDGFIEDVGVDVRF